jgi:hypothetical protein
VRPESFSSFRLRQAAISWSAASLPTSLKPRRTSARPTLRGSRPEPSATADRLASAGACGVIGVTEFWSNEVMPTNERP